MSDHFVWYELRDGDTPRIRFECRGDEKAECRTQCDLCAAESQEQQCVCDQDIHGPEADQEREPQWSYGHSCNYLAWMDDNPDECYNGETQPVRGPEPEPVIFEWEGDYYTWDYAT